MGHRLSIAVLLSIFIATLTLVTASDPVVPLSRTSNHSLRDLERLGAYRCELTLTDANGKRLGALHGVARKSATLHSSPIDGQPGFAVSMRTEQQADGKIHVRIELAERTNMQSTDDNLITWDSTNVIVERADVQSGNPIELTLSDWDTAHPSPLSVQFKASPFRAGED